jgi:hypothetical protein
VSKIAQTCVSDINTSRDEGSHFRVTKFELISMANISGGSAIEGPAEYLAEHPRRLFVLFH